MLYLTRHAKSSWNNLELDDFQRPLNDRGEKDAPHMARLLKDHGIIIDHIFSSPAVRALDTAKKIALGLRYPENKITTDQRIYHADEETLLEVIQESDNAYHSIMLVGHNPGLTEFTNRLLHVSIDIIPTCGIVAAKLNIELWEELHWRCGQQEFFYYPKKAP